MEYRFITPDRTGKWYPDLATAQANACQIGAGYYDRASGAFFKYRETQLEVRRWPVTAMANEPTR